MELFSVSDGKYHKPAIEPTRADGWKARLTVCGRIVTPQNFFETAADADHHTGGRLSEYLCRRCAAGHA